MSSVVDIAFDEIRISFEGQHLLKCHSGVLSKASQTWTTSIAGYATTLNITEAKQQVCWPLKLDSCTAVVLMFTFRSIIVLDADTKARCLCY